MKGLLLLSGGIDSPVAGYLMMKKMDVEAVYFDNSPFSTSGNLERAKDSARAIGLKKLIVVKHGELLKEYMKNSELKYQCVFCKRMMVKDAESLALKRGFDCLIMGDNLAQVASQTLQNIATVSKMISIPVLRPLIGMDKQEIIEISKKINTYEISIRPVGCCSAVPPKPATKSEDSKMREEEAKFDVPSLSRTAIENTEELVL